MTHGIYIAVALAVEHISLALALISWHASPGFPEHRRAALERAVNVWSGWKRLSLAKYLSPLLSVNAALGASRWPRQYGNTSRA